MKTRYDAVAPWYAEATREWQPVCLPYLPDDLSGRRLLDLACGIGALSRELAERGAEVTAVDASAEMLRRAAPGPVRYVHGDATNTDWWDGDPFDGVVSNMAMMDIDDLDAALHTIVATVKPDRWVLISLLHPCFPGQPETDALSSWPPDRGYSWEGWWTTGSDGVRGHVGAHHRTLATYLNAVIRTGLRIDEVIEPPADVPHYLVLRCARAQTSDTNEAGRQR